MLTAEIGSHHRQLATCWNELSRRQLLQLAQAHGQEFPSAAHQHEALLHILLQVPRRVFQRLNGVQRIELRRYARFLREPQENASFTTQLLPVLWCRLRRYFGPRDNFRNLRFHEFIFADTYFLRYVQTNDEAWLDQLVAVLYRPQRAGYAPYSVKYEGDRREDFSEHLVAARAQRLARLPHYVKYAVLLWYRGCRHNLERRYDYVFTESTQKKAAGAGWQDVLHELAGTVHQLDATANQPLHAVLREMNRQLRQAEQRQEQAANH
jgi:hypothetical protein